MIIRRLRKAELPLEPDLTRRGGKKVAASYHLRHAGLRVIGHNRQLIGVHPVRRVSRPRFGLAVQQADAQDQLFAVPYQLHDPVRVFRLPVSVVFRIPAKAPFLIAQP